MFETLITLEGSDRPKRRRFAKLCEKFGVFNGWCSDGITARVLSESQEAKDFLELSLSKLDDFKGVGKFTIND